MELFNFSAQELIPTSEPLVLPYIPADEQGAVLVGFPRESSAPEYIDLQVSVDNNVERIMVQAQDGRHLQIIDAQSPATSRLKPYAFREAVQNIHYVLRPDIGYGTWTYDEAAGMPGNLVNPTLFRSFSAKICIGAVIAQRRLKNQ